MLMKHCRSSQDDSRTSENLFLHPVMLIHVFVTFVIILMMQPRILQRAHRGRDRTRIGTLTVGRCLPTWEYLNLMQLTAKGALQETRRDSFMSFRTENYEVFYFGECSGSRSVGIAVHKRFLHSSTRGVASSDGRLMTMDILLQDAISTDHRPVICELNFRPRVAPKSSTVSPTLDVWTLCQNDIKEAFQNEIETSLENAKTEEVPPEQIAASIRSATVSAAQKVIPGKCKLKHPQEFSQATIALIHRKRRLWTFLEKSGRRVTR